MSHLIFSRIPSLITIAITTLLMAPIFMPPIAHAGNLPDAKKTVVAKMSCGEIKELLSETRSRILFSQDSQNDATDDIFFDNKLIDKLAVENKKVSKSLGTETDPAKKTSLKAEKQDIAKQVKNLKKQQKADYRVLNKIEKQLKKLREEEIALKRELKERKCR